MSEIRSLLVYSMGEVIGDGLIKLPFVASLRDAFPNATVHWCAAKGETVYADVLKPIVAGLIDEAITEGVTGALVSDLVLLRRPFGGRRFDLILDTQTNVRRSLVAKRAARIFVSPAANFRLSDRRPEGLWPEAMVDRLQTLASLGAGREVRARPVPLTNGPAFTAARMLLPDGPAYVGFAPGAGGVSKRWPLDRFIELAQEQNALGRTPVFFLGPDEIQMQSSVRAALPDAVFPELDRSDPYLDVKGPLLVIALAGRLVAAVANDAGPGHMLAAGGAPLLSLQGSRRKAAKFHPAAQRLRMLVAEDYGGALQMELIPRLDAADALTALIGAGR